MDCSRDVTAMPRWSMEGRREDRSLTVAARMGAVPAPVGGGAARAWAVWGGVGAGAGRAGSWGTRGRTAPSRSRLGWVRSRLGLERSRLGLVRLRLGWKRGLQWRR